MVRPGTSPQNKTPLKTGTHFAIYPSLCPPLHTHPTASLDCVLLQILNHSRQYKLLGTFPRLVEAKNISGRNIHFHRLIPTRHSQNLGLPCKAIPKPPIYVP